MQQQRESPHKALIGLWERPDRAWIGFRKPGCGEGRRGRLNRTHASFLNSLAGPKKGRENGGREIKESIGSGEGRAGGQGLFSASLVLNAAANSEKLQFITPPPPERACTETHAHGGVYSHLKSVKYNGKNEEKKLSLVVAVCGRRETRRAKSEKCAKMKFLALFSALLTRRK